MTSISVVFTNGLGQVSYRSNNPWSTLNPTFDNGQGKMKNDNGDLWVQIVYGSATNNNGYYYSKTTSWLVIHDYNTKTSIGIIQFRFDASYFLLEVCYYSLILL